jgi:translocation and assembly module TamB
MSAPANPQPNPVRRSPWRHVLRIAVGVVVIVVLSLGAISWYASTPAFENRVRQRVIATLEQATGGRVELGAFRWRILHLEFEADNLTIHGLEASSEIPYAHVDRLLVRAKILSFFRPKVGLNLLRAERPVIHLIIYPDGSTNQPRPKTESSGGKPIKDTLFDLAVDRAELIGGLAMVNQRATPFDLSANDLGLTVTYTPVNDAYLAALQVSDLTAQRGKQPPVHSKLTLQVDLRRNSANMSLFRLQTGPSLLEATASFTNFNDPQWILSANGRIDVREVEALTAIPGLREGIADLQVKGQGSTSKFNIDGNAKVAGAGYHMYNVEASGVDVSTTIHVTQDELTLPRFDARLTQGGTVDGEIRILHWLAPLPGPPTEASGRTVKTHSSSATAVRRQPQQGIIRANVHGVTLRTLMGLLTPPRYQDLGFDTAATGLAKVDWIGNADDLTAEASMKMAPSAPPVPGQVPLSGSLDAKYFNRNGSVQIAHLDAQTPGTQIHVEGALGVYPLSRQSVLTADLTTSNLGEFDRTLVALGLSANGQKGVKAIPVQLHGQAEFHGAVTGTISNPDVKGHLIATNFETDFPAAAQPTPRTLQASNPPAAQAGPVVTQTEIRKTMRWDRLEAQAEFNPQMLAVQQATLSRGATSIHASGQLRAHAISHSRLAFDDFSAIKASVQVQNAGLTDILTMAGSTIPVTGTVSLQAHIGGLVGNLDGGGHLTLLGGEAYGEPYRSLNADLTFAGREIGATQLTLLQNGGQLSGKGGFNLTTKSFHFDAQGQGFELAHFRTLQKRAALAGQLNFQAHGTGTLDDPNVQASLHITKLALGSRSLGWLDADAHTDHRTLFLTANSDLQSAQVKVNGQMQLSGDYLTQARLTVANLDLDPLLRLANIQGLNGHSSLDGTATITGPAREPKRMNGDLTVQQFSVSLAGVPLKSDGPVHAKLQDGVLHLDPLHIVGDDTDLRAQGTLQVFDPDHEIDMKSSGNVNLKLAQSFNPNLTSSGHVDFTLDASGTLQKPDLGGQVKFTNVTLALLDLPNGLSQMNGTLVFDQDRLEVKELTAMTGGGQLKIGGFITYQQGLYGDLSVSGKDIRIRYPQGISSMADAKLRLQGSPNNMTLSGNVELTRFAINPNLDFAALSSSNGGVKAPPDPNSPSSHFRLDVHITSAPELNFQNSYAKLAGDVDLHVRGTLAQPSVLGHITVTEGSATFAGTQYQLQHGDIFFTNPVTIEPVIDLDATAHVEEYDLTIGLHGTMSKLNFTYRSEPPLPQADIFALLALGRTQEEQQIYSQQQQQAGVNSTADALLGGALNATVSSRIQRLFGGGSVKIDPTFVGTLGSSTARITVEQRISRNATLTYATNVNSTAQQLIQGQLDLTRNVSLVAVRDESGVFSLVIKVHKRFR